VEHFANKKEQKLVMMAFGPLFNALKHDSSRVRFALTC